MKVEFTRDAEADLESIADYIARDSPRQAERFVDRLKARCLQIANAPRAATLRSDLIAGIRMVPFGCYLIFYTHDDRIVRIERIIHGSRDLSRLFGQGP